MSKTKVNDLTAVMCKQITLLSEQISLVKKLLEMMDKDMACMEHQIMINDKALNTLIGRFNDTKTRIHKKKST